jgi:hypothetical protein
MRMSSLLEARVEVFVCECAFVCPADVLRSGKGISVFKGGRYPRVVTSERPEKRGSGGLRRRAGQECAMASGWRSGQLCRQQQWATYKGQMKVAKRAQE